MSRSSVILGLALGAALLTSVTRPAHAQVVILGTQTQSFTNQTLELNGSPSLVLDRYNGGGTLTQVDISVSASITGSGTVRNTAGAPQTFTVSQLISQFDLSAGSGAPSALANLVNPNTGATFSPFDDAGIFQLGSRRYTSLGSNTSAAWGPFTVSANSTNATFTNALDLAGFVGSGTFSLDPFTSIGTAISGGGGNVSTNITDVASVSVTVTYRGVSAVPEPSTWVSGGLLACAALGRAARSRRPRAKV